MHGVGQLAEKFHRFQVDIAAVFVGTPFTALLAVIQVQHTGHSIHPQSVDVVLFQPEGSAAHQEAQHLVAAEVKDSSAPVGVFVFQRIRIFIAESTVKLIQAVGVFGEVGGNPVQNHSDAGFVALVDEIHKSMGSAVPGGGGKVTGDLIAPGGLVGIFSDGHQLDVSVTHLLHIGDKLFRYPGVTEVFAVVVLAPASHVHLIDIHGRLQRVLCLFPFPIGVVGPLEAADVVDFCGGAGAGFHVVTVGVALIIDVSVRTLDVIFIRVVNRNIGDKALPAAAVAETAHFRRSIIVPVIEIAYHPDALGVGRPDTEDVPVLSILFPGVGAKEIIGTVVFAAVENVQGKILILGCCFGLLRHRFSCCIF